MLPRPLILALLALAGCGGSGSSKPAAVTPVAPPVVKHHPATAVAPVATGGKYEATGATFTGHPGREALELVGYSAVTIRKCVFVGGSTNLRINGCPNVLIENCVFGGVTGPADPDGQNVQLINSVGTIRNCRFVASPDSEDLLSIFADAPIGGAVTVTGCIFSGRGRSDSGNGLCADGSYCPPVFVTGCAFAGNRCGITIAGGVGSHVSGSTFANEDTDVYIEHGQGYVGPFGSHVVSGAKALLGAHAGAGNKVTP